MLQKRVESLASEKASKGEPHGVAAFKFIDNILENNNLLPVWEEFPDIKPLINKEKGDELKLLEK